MPKAKRIAEPGKRHRRDNGPQALEVAEAPPLNPAEMGAGTVITQEILQGGPRALIAATRKAEALAQRFGVDFSAQWCLKTKWLQAVESAIADADTARMAVLLKRPETADLSVETGRPYMRGRTRGIVRYALMWRPTFLAAKALTRSTILGAKAANVSQEMADRHRVLDPEFDAQCIAAEEYAVQLLHDVTFRDALEGTAEPVYWQGIRVGYVRKFDNRLRIEMLRAHMPATFKTPGSHNGPLQPINNNILIADPATIAQIQALRQESLQDLAVPSVPSLPG